MTKILGRVGEAFIALVVLVLVLLPVLLVVWVSFFKTEFIYFPPSGYSLKWYRNLANQPDFLSSAILSVLIAVIAMLCSVVLGTLAALGLDRSRSAWAKSLQTLVLAPIMVPGIVMGTAVFVAYTRFEQFTGVEVMPSNFMLILGHVLITVPWTIRLVSSALLGMNHDIEAASRNLGASALETLVLVVLPQIRSSMIAAGLFSFIMSLGNIEVSLMLLPGGETTLPIQIANYMTWSTDPTIAALSTVQVLVTTVVLIITNKFVKLADIVR